LVLAVVEEVPQVVKVVQVAVVLVDMVIFQTFFCRLDH
jgi:hypothetical protein